MEGFVKIEATPDKGLSIEVDLHDVSIQNRLEIIDAVVEALEFDKNEMRLVSLVLAMGGLGSMPGVERRKVEFDRETFELFEKKRDEE